MKRWCFDAETGFFDVWTEDYERKLDFYVKQFGYTPADLDDRPTDEFITKQLVEAENRAYAYLDDFDFEDLDEWEDAA
jgi:predicted enzyme related to lactoylglutathione lyase